MTSFVFTAARWLMGSNDADVEITNNSLISINLADVSWGKLIALSLVSVGLGAAIKLLLFNKHAQTSSVVPPHDNSNDKLPPSDTLEIVPLSDHSEEESSEHEDNNDEQSDHTDNNEQHENNIVPDNHSDNHDDNQRDEEKPRKRKHKHKRLEKEKSHNSNKRKHRSKHRSKHHDD